MGNDYIATMAQLQYSRDKAGGTASDGIRKRSKRCNGNISRNRCFDTPLTCNRMCEEDRSSQLNHGRATSPCQTRIALRVSNISGSTVTITTSSGQCTSETGHSENSLTIRQSSNGRVTSDETHQPRDDSLLPETIPQTRFSYDVETNPVTLQAVCKDVSFLISMRE